MDFFLVNEISRNIDAYRLSTFFYKERGLADGKLYAGPLWDFNLAFGNADYCNGQSTEGWSYLFNTVCPDDYYFVPFWWDRFLQDSYFVNKLNCRWNKLRNEIFTDHYIDNFIDSIAQLLDEAKERNFEKWPILGQYVWPNPYIGQTYQDEVTYMKNWISDRINWLDDNMPGICMDKIIDYETDMLSFSVFPNPATSSSCFLISLSNSDIGQLEIFDLTGVMIKKFDHLELNAGDNKIYFNMNNPLKSGVYLAKYTNSAGEVRTLKFVVQH